MKILIAGTEIVLADGIMNPANNMSNPMAPPNIPGFGQGGDPGVQGPGGSDPYRGDIQIEDIGFPMKHFDVEMAEPKIPDMRKVKRIANPYPMLKKIFNQPESKESKEAMKNQKYPTVQKVMADLSDARYNLEKLGVDSAQEFATHFRGRLDQLAKEHDLGDLLGYTLLDRVIIIVGEANCLLLDYEFENPEVKPFYLFDDEASAEEAPVEPETPAEEPAEPEPEEAE
jgi:hypothetical protein